MIGVLKCLAWALLGLAGASLLLILLWLGTYFVHTAKLQAISRFASRSKFRPKDKP